MVGVKDSTRTNQTVDGEHALADWLENLPTRFSPEEREQLRLAAEMATDAHRHQRRASGEPYVLHAFAVANILLQLNLDSETVCAAILHDVVEDTRLGLEDIKKQFGHDIAHLVDGVTKMDLIHQYRETDNDKSKREWANVESLRKLLLAMVEDVRVVLIKLADRLHNLRTLQHLPVDKQKRIAKETLDIFAPLANRMGIWQIKWELEDLSFRYLEPETYKRIAALLDEKRINRERYIEAVINSIQTKLDEAHIKAEVSGRPKHIYSIWRKMQRKNINFDEVFDVRAIRVIVGNLTDCYGALGVVHTLWQHIPREFDDYITTPKGNQYRSLHTAVIGPQGRTLEVQIRTREMHEHAELGVAAHWRYKEGTHYDAGFEQKIAWLRQLLEWKDEEASASDFVDRFKAEAFEDRVYVFTPKGNVVDLPKGATPLDFAYYIHTEIGHRCRGAKVNGNIVPLTYELKTGEQVDILTTRNGTPSRDWLNKHLGYLNTSRARAKVRTWFKQQDLEKNTTTGRQALERELHRLGVQDIHMPQVLQRFAAQTADELYAQIGRGDLGPGQVAAVAHEIANPQPPETSLLREAAKPRRNKQPDDITIEGVGNLMTHIARCCKPAPGDPIIGFITLGRGVTIHRRDCSNILRLPEEKRERLIEVNWGGAQESTYPVDVSILAYDRQGLLRDITNVLSNEKVNVLAVNTMTDVKDHMARMQLTLEINNTEQLSTILAKLSQLSNVVEARRRT